MSTALDIIIARGFGSPIQGAMDSFNNQRQANQSNKLSGILQQNTAQDQQWQGEDRALEEQARQKASQKAQEQESLLAMIPEIDARLRANPDDQEARAAAVEIHSRLNPEKAAEGIGGMLYPKESGPQSSLGKLGADLSAGRISQADYDAAVRKATTIPSPAQINASFTPAQIMGPDGTPQTVMVNTRNPAEQVSLGATPPKTQAPKTTDTQRAAAGYVSRMERAEAALNNPKVGLSGYVPGQAEFMAWSAKQGGSTVANRFVSKAGQRYFQLAEDWLRAKLRKESGAVIGKEEAFQEYSTYFPVPGDSEEVLAQKRNSRVTAIEALQGQSPQGSVPAKPQQQPATAQPRTFTTKGGATVEILD